MRRKPCEKCGGEKEPGHGRRFCVACERPRKGGCRDCGGPRPPRKQLCDECRELRGWRRNARRRATRRQPCSQCGRPKGEGQRRRLCDRCLAERDAIGPCTKCLKRPRRYAQAKLCEPCKLEADARLREYNRLRYHRRKHKIKKRRYRKPTKAKQRQINERHRMNTRLRAERRGQPVRPVSEAAYVRKYGYGSERVPVSPLVPLLAELTDLTVFAEGAGVDRSTVDRIVNGRLHDLRLVEADRIYTALGLPISYAIGDVA